MFHVTLGRVGADEFFGVFERSHFGEEKRMFHTRIPVHYLSVLLLVGLLSAACNGRPAPTLVFNTAAPVTETPAGQAASETVAPAATETTAPLATDTSEPPTVPPADTATTAPALPTRTSPPPTEQPAVNTRTPNAPVPVSGSGLSSDYLDDRSTATGLIQSYFNAINMKQYLRAYSYWEKNSKVGPYDKFQQGYQDTASVQVTLGTISGDAGAGQRYFTVPAVLVAQTTNGKTQTFAACYTLHLASPDIQGVPPFNPLAIATGTAKAATNGAKAKDILAHTCDGVPQGSTISPAPVTNTRDITSGNYLDDRSNAVDVLSSLFNAVNRKEYVRAYSYWETNSEVGPFDKFQQGYANTASVQLTIGKVTSGAGAGQIYYTVPAVLKAKTTGGATQIFSACYILHLSRPEIQGVPPFQPLAIQSATAKAANNGSDTDDLLRKACAGQP
jgi:hypothetical protein